MARKKEISIVLSAKDKTKKAFKSVTNGFKNVTNKLNSFITSGKGLFTGVIVGVIGKFFVDTVRGAETLRASLETATQSTEEADRVLKLLDKNAGRLNSTVAELSEGWINLVNAGIEPSIERLEYFSNVAAGTPGKTLDQYVQAVADALRGQNDRLAEFGISAEKQGENVAFTFRGVTEVVKNSTKEITGYFESLGKVQFAGGVARQAVTIDGAFKNLTSSFGRLAKAVDKRTGISGYITKIANALTDYTNAASKAVAADSPLEKIANEIASFERMAKRSSRYGPSESVIQKEIERLKEEAQQALALVKGPDGLRQQIINIDEEIRKLQQQYDQLKQRAEAAGDAKNKALGDNRKLGIEEALESAGKKIKEFVKKKDELYVQLRDRELYGPENESAKKSTKELGAILNARLATLREYADKSKEIAINFTALSDALANLGKGANTESILSVGVALDALQKTIAAGEYETATNSIEVLKGKISELIEARGRYIELSRIPANKLSADESSELDSLRRNWAGSREEIEGAIIELERFAKTLNTLKTEKKLIDADSAKSEIAKIVEEVNKTDFPIKLNPDLSALTSQLDAVTLSMIVNVIPIVVGASGSSFGDNASPPEGATITPGEIETDADKRGYRMI